MLPEAQWHVLGLEPQAATAKADFFEAFADLVAHPPSPQPRQLAELSRVGEPRAGLEAFGNPPGMDEEPSFEAAERDLPEMDLPDWQRRGFEADALRQAAIAALLIDTRRGLALLRRASDRYQGMSRSFALLLKTVSDPSPANAESAYARLRAHYGGDMTRPDVPLDAIAEVQEIHLALAASAAPGLIDPAVLEEFNSRPGARSPAWFGTGSAPVFEWWAFASSLMRGAVSESLPEDRDRLADALVHLAGGHGGQLESAQLDSFHWRKLAGIPELIDLEVACAVCLTNFQLAARQAAPISAEDFEARTDIRLESPADARQYALAQISLQVGVEMARDNEEPPPAAQAPAGPLASV